MKLWIWLLNPDNRQAATFVATIVFAIVGSIWALFTYFDRPLSTATPTPSVANMPIKQETEPEPEPETRDEALTRQLVGRWSAGLRRYPNNVSMQVEYTFHPGGTFNWRGMGSGFTLLTSGSWSISNGQIETIATSSNFPALVPVNSRYASPIHELTSTHYSYTDAILGTRVRDRRLSN